MNDEQLNSGLGELRDRVGHLERQMTVNTEATRRIETNTADLIDLFNSFRGGFKVLEYIGKLAKPLGAIIAMIAAIAGLWATLKGGR